MKKVFIATLVMFSIAMEARMWTVYTTCGVQGSINLADNATTSQIAAAVSQYNLNNCGVRPSRVIIEVIP